MTRFWLDRNIFAEDEKNYNINEITKIQWDYQISMEKPKLNKKTKTQFGTIQIAEEKSIKISKWALLTRKLSEVHL